MAFLASFGKYLPPRVVTNAELAPLLSADPASIDPASIDPASIDPAWIEEMSGIAERRWAEPEASVASLAAAAAQDALSRANFPAAELDAILVSCGSPERRFPGPAAEVQHLLGASRAFALDLPLASAGSLFALAQADVLLSRFTAVLVVAAEKLSPTLLAPPIEKGTAMLFGDGAGAALLLRDSGLARITGFHLATDGANAADLALPLSGPLHMNGRAVILHASRKVPAAIRTLLDRHSLTPAEVPYFLMHQANANLITKIAQSLEVPPARFFSNIARYGNTSSASLLIAAAEWQLAHGFSPSTPTIFAAFGAGFHWGALLAHGV
ncbi:MAG: ketoacyl-ACP synthase III [Bryobacter sp.]|nr:ketoacyl-ACP synthase III [Bryobacter sp.]